MAGLVTTPLDHQDFLIFQKYLMKSFAEAFNASSTVAINHAEHWKPKEMNLQNPSLLSSNRSSNASIFTEKDNPLASTENLRSIPVYSEELQE
jgi:hypothetical protein